MKFGLMFVNSGPFSNPDLLAHLAITAEKCGFESLWTVEHVVIPKGYQTPYPYSKDGKIPGGEDVAIPDPLLPLGFVAALTKKIKLATGVMILPQRHPLYVAKELATLDLLSGGRTILGIGSGWLKEEFDALGLDFHARGARTDEAIKSMRFTNPVQKNGVPVHICGHSPAAAKHAGRLGDGFFPALSDPPKLTELFGLMREAAAKAGRDAKTIELSCIGRAKADAIKPLEDVGIARVILAPPGFDQEALSRGLEKIGNEVIARM
jgi:alkanesulfonate monooxygenase SsuD/methylene tetrahydromethanopterin reductase-like flavin-dependent oxidoreductase (luciferase family)